MNWSQIKSASGVQWEGHPACEEHALDVWPHEKEGFSWCVVTADVMDNAPEGWSSTVNEAMQHAEAAYFEWLDVMEGRKPIHDEEATALLLAELEVSLQALKEENAMLRDAVAEERAAVVAWLRRKATDDFCALRVKEACDAEKSVDAIERGEHRNEEKG